MRKRFEQQLSFGTIPIEETSISLKAKDAITEVLAGLLELYKNKEYNEKIFSILEDYLVKNKNQTGRSGMDLWQVFVLAQIRLCKKLSYEDLHAQANNHYTLRRILGVCVPNDDFVGKKFEYQNIYDNVSRLSDEMLLEINEVIVDFGHKEVYKKKAAEALRLKSDSFAVESNVHFPTDYNLLWDSARKCIEAIFTYTDKYDTITGWRKLPNWRYELKGLMRELGKASASGGKGKEKREKYAAGKYLQKARAFEKKLKSTDFPIADEIDLSIQIMLNHYISLLSMHIYLVEHRILKGETIPHDVKLFSIFETYTEWIKKGKTRPNVELGKKLCITTDQYNLIIDYQIMDNEQDRAILLKIADRVLACFQVNSWSFDKGFWSKDNKTILQLLVPKVVMSKLGKKNKSEQEEESSREFKKLKNKHSAIESNINELEHRGLDRCPDRGIFHYNTYIALGICAYNLKKIGKKILDTKRLELKQIKPPLKIAA